MTDPPDFDPAACRAALDATEVAGVPVEVVAMLRRLVDREESPWIGVDDALPTRRGKYLVYDEVGRRQIADCVRVSGRLADGSRHVSEGWATDGGLIEVHCWAALPGVPSISTDWDFPPEDDSR